MSQGAGEPGSQNFLLSERIIGACIEVHRALGPGLLETAYETALCHELSLCGLGFTRQVSIPVLYKGVALDCAYRLDLVVEETIVLELKSVEQLTAIHIAQLLTYLKLTSYELGLLINFNAPVLARGLRRLTHKK